MLGSPVLAALVTRAPGLSLTALLAWDPAGLGSQLVGRVPGSADSGGLGGAQGRAGYGHTLFPNRCLLPDIPRQLLSSRKRPMQSLSWRLEAGITLAAQWDESAALRAQ